MSDKTTRRDVLRAGFSAAAGAVAVGAGGPHLLCAQQPAAQPAQQPASPAGPQTYEAIVPDTLDLADRANLGINALIGEIEPKFNYECWWMLYLTPPSARPHSNQWFDQNPRNLWALTLLRMMTGSQFGLDLEGKMMESMFSRMTDDGLFLNAPFDTPGAWWRSGGSGRKKFNWPKKVKEDFTNVDGLSEMLYAMVARYLRDGDPAMRERGQKVADALSRIAIQKEDYAYYPATADFGAEYSYFKDSGWPDTKEATSDFDDPEGAVSCYHAIVVGSLSRWAGLTGDKKALETAGKLVKYVLKPQFWMGGCSVAPEPADAKSLAGKSEDLEHIDPTKHDKKYTFQQILALHGALERRPAAFFQGHLAGLTYTLTGLMEYACVANDPYVKEWVRQGYEYFRNFGLARIAMFGENITNNQPAEVAIKLCDAGVGDYWDDVDQYVRNTIVEDQFVDLELLKQEAKKLGFPTHQSNERGDFTIERFLGSLRMEAIINGSGVLDPTNSRPFTDPKVVSPLVAGVYVEPFYFIWEAITRYRDGVAQVNLLLNRASAWLDIDSYLPYEGKVVLKNKTCKGIHVRIPSWVDRREISCTAAGAKLPFAWAGNFLVLSGLAGNETITIGFPMVETVETYYLVPRDVGPRWWEHKDKLPTYVLHMKGNTCIKAEFPNRDKFTKLAPVYPIFQRDHFKANKAPMKKVTRYVHSKVVEW
jgi:hypothetical protein